jgi:hypothetical protein
MALSDSESFSSTNGIERAHLHTLESISGVGIIEPAKPLTLRRVIVVAGLNYVV